MKKVAAAHNPMKKVAAAHNPMKKVAAAHNPMKKVVVVVVDEMHYLFVQENHKREKPYL